jgi:glycosyltransferase involved in cell wall biosynthesis
VTTHEPRSSPIRDVTISVAIATLRRPDILRGALESIVACSPPPDEIIIVDGDPDASAEPVAAAYADHGISVVYLRSPAGLARQRNVAVDAAGSDVICFVDDDVVVDAGLFGPIAETFRDPSVVGATGRVIEEETRSVVGKHSPIRSFLPGGGREGFFTRYGYPHRLVHLEEPKDIGFMHGSLMVARVDVARLVRFDDSMPGYALAEDEDFSYRVSRIGRIRYEPRARLHHLKTGFRTLDQRAFGRDVVNNRLHLFRKNFPQTRRAKVEFALFVGLLVAHRLANREWRGALGLTEGALQAIGRVRAKQPDPGAVRVTFVSSHARVGGAERYLTELLEALDGSVVGGVIALERGPLVEALRSRGHRVTVVPTGRHWYDILASARVVHAHLRTDPTPAVHANGTKAAMVSAIASTLLPAKVIWVKHDFSFDGWKTALLASRMSAIVGVSEAVLRAIPLRSRRKTCVVPNAVRVAADPDAITGRERLRSVFSDIGPVEIAGLIGRMHPLKGHHDVLDALAAVKAERPDLRVVFIGGVDPAYPSYAEALMRRAEHLGLNGLVAWLGHRDDVRDLIAGLDVGIVASWLATGPVEAASLSALELLAAGTPVVAYDQGGVPEVVDGCAHLVAAGDARGLGRALVEVLDDEPLRRKMALCGRAVAGRRTVEDVAREMRRIYERTVR